MSSSRVIITNEHIEAANKIIDAYLSGVRWSILIAQMQSGKTFTFLLVCSELIRLQIIESVIIFSGTADTDLKEQLEETIRGKHNNDDDTKSKSKSKVKKTKEFFIAYRRYLRSKLRSEIEDEDDRNDECERIANEAKSNIRVKWGSELNKFKEQPEKTLFIWEEAHFAQNLNQCPDKFLRQVGIAANGDNQFLEEKRNYVLTVSATPFSELSDNIHRQQDKNVVYLRAGTGYNSVKNIRDSERLKSFKSVEDTLPKALNKERSTPKYAVVRISKTNENQIITIIKDNHWDFVIYDTLGKDEKGEKDQTIIDKGQQVWDNMENEPEKDTVILVRGKCRMGKNLEKEHILFVMETAKSSNTDTVLQSLLGRVCGYSPGSDKIDVYLHENIFKNGDINSYIELVEGIEQYDTVRTMPSKARNLTEKKIKAYDPIIPIRILKKTSSNDRSDILSDVYNAFTTEAERIYNKNSEYKFEEVAEKIRNSYIFDNSKLNIGYLKNKATGTRTAEKAFEINNAFQNSVARDFGSGSGIDSEGLEVKLWVPKRDIPELSDYIYITAHVKKHDFDNIMASVPKTTENEVFAHTLEDGRKVCSNGGLLIELPIDSSEKIEVMKTYIIDFVFISRTYTKSRSVTSQWDDKDKEWKGILVNKEVEAALLPGGDIYNSVFEEGFQLNLTRSSGRPKTISPGFNKYASISWVDIK